MSSNSSDGIPVLEPPPQPKQQDAQQSQPDEHDLERGEAEVSSSLSIMSPTPSPAKSQPQHETPPPLTVANTLSLSPSSSSSFVGSGGDYEEDDTLLIEIPAPGLSLRAAAAVKSLGSDPVVATGRGPDQPRQPCEMRQVSGLCPICLCTFQVGSDIVWSSNSACEHVFHAACIEKWLMKQREGPLCPCCRRDFIVDPYDMEEVGDVYYIDVGNNADSHDDDADGANNNLNSIIYNEIIEAINNVESNFSHMDTNNNNNEIATATAMNTITDSSQDVDVAVAATTTRATTTASNDNDPTPTTTIRATNPISYLFNRASGNNSTRSNNNSNHDSNNSASA
jgi:hypothetical protein